MNAEGSGMEPLRWAQDVVLVAFVVTIIVTDWRWRRIPNVVTYPTMLVGLALAAIEGFPGQVFQSGLLDHAAGLAIAFFISYPIVALGGMKAGDGKFLRTESKSGSILCRVNGDHLIATKVNGKYWMYYNVPHVQIATSDDLIEWTPLEDADGHALKVLSPRAGFFDSWLVEAGPPAILTERGIVLLYNAGNLGTHGDPRLPQRVYTGGQALFDARNPLKLLDRSDEPFIKPTEDYEKTGQYIEGTTFVEAMIPFRGRWFLYYGTADSRVGVAVSASPSRR